MAQREKKPPKIHPKFESAGETPQVVNTNLATSVPETGTVYAGTYLQYQVLYRVNEVGRKVIVDPPSLLGVVINP